MQGVYYRAWTYETATSLGLDGWVRNREDGSVEAVFSGSPDVMAEMLERAEIDAPYQNVRPGDDTIEELAGRVPTAAELTA